MAKRDTLKRPMVHPRQASIELSPWGHWPKGLSASGISFVVERLHDLQTEKKKNYCGKSKQKKRKLGNKTLSLSF